MTTLYRQYSEHVIPTLAEGIREHRYATPAFHVKQVKDELKGIVDMQVGAPIPIMTYAELRKLFTALNVLKYED